jgi:hypothetical protein
MMGSGLLLVGLVIKAAVSRLPSLPPKEPTEESRQQPQAPSQQQYGTAAGILIAIGICGLGFGFFLDATGGRNVYNIGLLNFRSNLVTAGGFAFLAGIVLHGTGQILNLLSQISNPDNDRCS